MNEQSFDDKMASVVARLTHLQQGARRDDAALSGPDAPIMQELSMALEELHVADEELRERNNELALASLRYQELFELAPDAFLATNLHGKIREANRAAATLLGLEQKDLVNRLLPSLVVERDRRSFRRHLARVAGGEPRLDQDVLIAPAGMPPVACAFSVLPTRDGAGHITGLLWLIRDIADRKRAQAETARALATEQKARSDLAAAHRALAESEARYRAIADLVPYGGWLADRLGAYTFASNSFLQLTGMTLAECQGDGWTKTLRPETRDQVLADWRACVRDGCTWDYEYEIQCADGTYRTVWSRGIPLRDDTGQVTGWGGLNIDITNRKQADESLRAAEERFRVALGDSPVTVFQQDSDLRYTWVYHPMRLRPDEMIGKRDDDINPPEISARLNEIKRSVLTTGARRREQVRWGADEFSGWVDLAVEPFYDGAGKIAGIIGTAADISELKREQAALASVNVQLDRAVAERTAELVEANMRLRGLTQTVVSVQEEERRRVSRELHDEAGQALTALKMNLEVMRDDMPADLPQIKAQLAEMVGIITNTLEQIRVLAQDLRPPALDAANISTVLEGLCRDFARRGRFEVYYRGASPSDTSEVVNVTLYRFVQEALTNVVRHAHATEATVQLDWDAEELTLSVRDNGGGFDLASKSPTLNPHGLGLIGMQERLKTVGGWLEIHSGADRGTQLVAHIPYKEAE